MPGFSLTSCPTDLAEPVPPSERETPANFLCLPIWQWLNRKTIAMRGLKMLTTVLLGLLAAGCAGIQEMRLAPNVVRLDVNPPGAPFTRDAALRRAAELTLESGYVAFRLSPLYSLAFNNYGVVVVMLRAGDPASSGAYDALRVLGTTSF